MNTDQITTFAWIHNERDDGSAALDGVAKFILGGRCVEVRIATFAEAFALHQAIEAASALVAKRERDRVLARLERWAELESFR